MADEQPRPGFAVKRTPAENRRYGREEKCVAHKGIRCSCLDCFIERSDEPADIRTRREWSVVRLQERKRRMEAHEQAEREQRRHSVSQRTSRMRQEYREEQQVRIESFGMTLPDGWNDSDLRAARRKIEDRVESLDDPIAESAIEAAALRIQRDLPEPWQKERRIRMATAEFTRVKREVMRREHDERERREELNREYLAKQRRKEEDRKRLEVPWSEELERRMIVAESLGVPVAFGSEQSLRMAERRAQDELAKLDPVLRQKIASIAVLVQRMYPEPRESSQRVSTARRKIQFAIASHDAMKSGAHLTEDRLSALDLQCCNCELCDEFRVSRNIIDMDRQSVLFRSTETHLYVPVAPVVGLAAAAVVGLPLALFLPTVFLPVTMALGVSVGVSVFSRIATGHVWTAWRQIGRGIKFLGAFLMGEDISQRKIIESPAAKAATKNHRGEIAQQDEDGRPLQITSEAPRTETWAEIVARAEAREHGDAAQSVATTAYPPQPKLWPTAPTHTNDAKDR